MALDEAAHIGAGLSYVQKLDLRLNEEHPPLAKILSGVLLAACGTSADYSFVAWRVSGDFFPAFFGEWIFGDRVVNHWNDPRRTLTLGRLPMLGLMLALGGLIFAIARRLGGYYGGLVCLACYVTSAVFLAFGPLVLTDTAITLFSLWSLWAFGGLWREPSRKNILLFAGALCCALLSKFSAGILLLVVFLFALVARWRPVGLQPIDKDAGRGWRKVRNRAVWKSILLAGAGVYVVYFVFSINQPVDIPGLADSGPLGTLLGRFLMPPWLILRGLALFLLTSRRPTFLLGQWYPHAVWFYFPVLFVLKSAPGFLALIVLTVGMAIGVRRFGSGGGFIPEQFRTHWRMLWLGLAVYVAVCLMSPMDISIRHFSVPMVLVMVLLAPLPAISRQAQTQLPTGARWVVPALLTSMVLSCLYSAVSAYPHYFPYFNFLAGGRPAYLLATDSNVDWDQALPEAERFAAAHAITDLPLDDFGIATTRTWVPQSRYWDCQQPSAAETGKWVVVSSNMILDSHNCEYLFHYPHETLAAGGMYAFHLPAQLPAAGSPGGPPLHSAYHYFPGGRVGEDARKIFLDAIQDPETMPATIAHYRAEYEKARKQRKKQ